MCLYSFGMVVIIEFLKKISCLLVIFLIFVNLSNQESIASDGETTLKEAIDIGFKRAKEWNVNATLTSVTSVDETMGGSRGEEGKRFNWTLFFVAPGTEDYLIIGISDKKIWLYRPGKQTQDPTIPYDEIKLDSSDVLQLAKIKYGLKPGKDWATGYHFTLNSMDGKPILTVFGNDNGNRFTRISFNARNGEVIEAVHKLPYGGGLITKEVGSENLNKKGMAITGVVAGKDKLVVWGDKKPTQFSTAKQPFIEWSLNGGKKWTKLRVNKYVKHAWFDRNDQLYAVTEKEIWAGITSKSKGRKILSLDHPIENVDFSINNNIVVQSNGKIFYTTNQGETWEKVIVPNPFYAIQISENGNL